MQKILNNMKTTKTMPTNETMTFRQVKGIWQRVDSQEPKPLILADALSLLNIVIDENCQFCRIIRYYDTMTETIIYRAYGGHISIQTIHEYEK